MKALIMRLFGKQIDAALGKYAISKTKIIAVIGVLVYAIEKLGPAFGVPITLPPDLFEILATLGLWTLKDGQDGPKGGPNA